jgi:hypothetical protein
MMIAILFLASLTNPGQLRLKGMSPVFDGVLIAAGTGFGLSFLATYVALWRAQRHRVKVWLGSAPYRARAERFWPLSHGRTNAAPFVTVTTLILALWGFLLSLSIVVMRAGQFKLIFLTVLLVGVFMAFPAFLVVFRVLDCRVFAQDPTECRAGADGEADYESAEGEGVY